MAMVKAPGPLMPAVTPKVWPLPTLNEPPPAPSVKARTVLKLLVAFRVPPLSVTPLALVVLPRLLSAATPSVAPLTVTVPLNPVFVPERVSPCGPKTVRPLVPVMAEEIVE